MKSSLGLELMPLVLILCLDGVALGGGEVTNPGDTLRFRFREAQIQATHIASKIDARYMPANVEPEVKEWLLENKEELLQDLEFSPQQWVEVTQPKCLVTEASSRGTNVLFLDRCAEVGDSWQAAGALLVDASLQHLRITDPSFRKTLVETFYDCWQNWGGDEANWHSPLTTPMQSKVWDAVLWMGNKVLIQFWPDDYRVPNHQPLPTNYMYFDPLNGKLTPIESNPTIPDRVRNSYHAWTGSQVFVWGGSSDNSEYVYDQGGMYTQATNAWEKITNEGAPSRRIQATVLWTGSEVLIWGGAQPGPGRFDFTAVNDGALYNPVTKHWRPIPDAPLPVRGNGGLWMNGKLYAFSNNKSVASFDPQSSQWTVEYDAPIPESPEPFPRPTVPHLLVDQVWLDTVDEHSNEPCYNGPEGSDHSCPIYDFNRKSWSTTASLPVVPESNCFSFAAPAQVMIWCHPKNGRGAVGATYFPAVQNWVGLETTGSPAGAWTSFWTGDAVVAIGRQGDYADLTSTMYSPGTNRINQNPGQNPKNLSTLQYLFIKGKEQAVDWLRKLQPELLGASVLPEVKDFIRSHRTQMATDLEQSSLEWLSDHASCGSTGSSPSAPIFLNPDACQARVATRTNAGELLIHEVTHHFGIDSEKFADDVALAVYREFRHQGGTAVYAEPIARPQALGASLYKWMDSALFALPGHGLPQIRGSDNTWRTLASRGPIPEFENEWATRPSLAWNGQEIFVLGSDFREGDLILKGYAINPKTGNIRVISPTDALTARGNPNLSWAGDKLVVWGGYDKDRHQILDGVIYDPAEDRWQVLPRAPINFSFAQESDITWTGTKLVVAWSSGQSNPSGHFYHGIASYDFTTNSWQKIPVDDRTDLNSVQVFWTGAKLIVTGKKSSFGLGSDLRAAIFDPQTLAWQTINPSGLGNSWETSTRGVWMGKRLAVIRQDRSSTAFALYDPAYDHWSSVPLLGVSDLSIINLEMAGDVIIGDSNNPITFHPPEQ